MIAHFKKRYLRVLAPNNHARVSECISVYLQPQTATVRVPRNYIMYMCVRERNKKYKVEEEAQFGARPEGKMTSVAPLAHCSRFLYVAVTHLPDVVAVFEPT